MKILMEPDFIYFQNKSKATLILKNCEESCEFCPACKLKSFQNYVKLHSEFDYTCEELTVYGSATSPYLNALFLRLFQENPELKIYVKTCCYNLKTEFDLVYSQIIHPSITSESSKFPSEFLIPAIGDYNHVGAFASKYAQRYPSLPISVITLESGNPDCAFWTESKIKEVQTAIEMKHYRI